MEYCDLEAVNGVFGFGCFWVRIYEYPFDDLEMILWFFFFFFFFYVGYRILNVVFSFLYCFFRIFFFESTINMFYSSMNLPFFSRARASVCVCVLMCTVAFPRQLSGCFFFSVLLLFPVPW